MISQVISASVEAFAVTENHLYSHSQKVAVDSEFILLGHTGIRHGKIYKHVLFHAVIDAPQQKTENIRRKIPDAGRYEGKESQKKNAKPGAPVFRFQIAFLKRFIVFLFTSHADNAVFQFNNHVDETGSSLKRLPEFTKRS